MLKLDEAGDYPPDPAGLTRALEAVSPRLVCRAPLVGALVGIEVPETPESAELDPEFRSFRLGEVVTEILDRVVPGPLLVVLEDTHAMDEASSELLGHVIARAEARPWLLVLNRRDLPTGLAAPESTTTRMRLEPLVGADAIELVQVASHDAPLSPHEAETLAERSGGNPLFLRELVAVARQSNSVESLPDSVEAVITARIDQLSANDRHFLRRISVLGRLAPFDMLDAVLDEVPTKEDPIWARLKEFVAPDSSGNLSFNHALVRDSAYDGLSYRLRRELHSRAAEAIRETFGAKPRGAGGASLHPLLPCSALPRGVVLLTRGSRTRQGRLRQHRGGRVLRARPSRCPAPSPADAERAGGGSRGPRRRT